MKKYGCVLSWQQMAEAVGMYAKKRLKLSGDFEPEFIIKQPADGIGLNKIIFAVKLTPKTERIIV